MCMKLKVKYFFLAKVLLLDVILNLDKYTIIGLINCPTQLSGS